MGKWFLARAMEASTWAGIAVAAETIGNATGFALVGHAVALGASGVAMALKGGNGDKKLAAQ